MNTFHPMSPFKFKVSYEIEAAQWTGENLDEMKKLLAGTVSSNEWDGVEVYSEYIEPYMMSGSGITGGGYNMLLFYAGDDIEVDPGNWVVLHTDGEVEIISDAEFKKLVGMTG